MQSEYAIIILLTKEYDCHRGLLR